MPGFYITTYEKHNGINNTISNNLVFDEIIYKEFDIKRATLSKFLDDKAFYQDDDFIIIMEGVLLNKKQLFEKYHSDKVHALIIKMYKANGECYFSEFRGSFSGALYIKHDDKWIVFTNHYGDSTVFYSHIDSNIVIGSQIRYIVDILRDNAQSLSLDEEAVYSMLTYGYMCEDFTYANEIKRLYPGYYLTYQHDKLLIKKYFGAKDARYDLSRMSEDEIIDEMDRLFKSAVKLEYDKDLEYGYKHLSQLSGGLDSRMCLWVANELGYKDITCMNFSQSGSLDDIIAREIARDLSMNIIVWPLDSAGHLFNIDGYVSMNYGMALYGGVGAEKEILDTINNDVYGLMHTGQVGDVVVGCFLESSADLNNFETGGAYSEFLKAKPINRSLFTDREDYLMFVRGFLGCLSAHAYTRNYTEVASPFLDVDFLEFCMSIPVELRADHKLYKKWIIKKYPGAAKYIWEHTGCRITDNIYDILSRKVRNIMSDPYILLRKLGFKGAFARQILVGMNPFDLWWNENENLRNTYESYYSQHINNGVISPTVRENIAKLYMNGTTIEKMLAITALASIAFYFRE